MENCPESVLTAMRALHGSLGVTNVAPARLDEAMPVDEDGLPDRAGDADISMQELVDADDSLDDAALAAMARRLKRARRG